MTQSLSFNRKFPPALAKTAVVDITNGTVSREWQDQFSKFSTSQFVPLTNAKRLTTAAGSFTSGSLAYESDTGIFFLANAGSWQYAAGVRFLLSKDVQTLGLGVHDSGYQVYVVDFAHGLLWTGSAWQYTPGDAGSGYIVPFVSAPNPATGWQLCDGSANIPRLNGDASVSYETVPNTPGSYYRQ